MVVDWQEMESAGDISDVYPKQGKAAEVHCMKLGDDFRFPLAEGALRQLGGLGPSYPKMRSFKSKEKKSPSGRGLPQGMRRTKTMCRKGFLLITLNCWRGHLPEGQKIRLGRTSGP